VRRAVTFLPDRLSAVASDLPEHADYPRVLAAFNHATGPLRAKEALGHELLLKDVEGTRAKLKRQVKPPRPAAGQTRGHACADYDPAVDISKWFEAATTVQAWSPRTRGWSLTVLRAAALLEVVPAPGRSQRDHGGGHGQHVRSARAARPGLHLCPKSRGRAWWGEGR
jgi:hypothetical protein